MLGKQEMPDFLRSALVEVTRPKSVVGGLEHLCLQVEQATTEDLLLAKNTVVIVVIRGCCLQCAEGKRLKQKSHQVAVRLLFQGMMIEKDA